jgi:hypothetical protein
MVYPTSKNTGRVELHRRCSRSVGLEHGVAPTCQKWYEAMVKRLSTKCPQGQAKSLYKWIGFTLEPREIKAYRLLDNVSIWAC